MSINQKRFWAQLGIFVALVVGWIALSFNNGTVLYWQNSNMTMTFYWLLAAAFAMLVIMNVTLGIIQKMRKEIMDERDKIINRKASLWATGVSYALVIILLLVIYITNTAGENELISTNFSISIVIVGGVTLLITQAATALIMYGRQIVNV